MVRFWRDSVNSDQPTGYQWPTHFQHGKLTSGRAMAVDERHGPMSGALTVPDFHVGIFSATRLRLYICHSALCESHSLKT